MFQEKYTHNYELAEVSPFTWWRVAPVDAFGFHEANRLRRALCGFEICGEADWKDAVEGDAAAAIGVAIRVAVLRPCAEAIVDLVATPVLVAALDDHPAARLLLSHMLMKRAACDPTATRLANFWLEANRIAARLTQSIKAQPRLRRPRGRRVVPCAPGR